MYEADPRVRAFGRLQVTHGTVHQVLRRNPLFAGYTPHRNHAAVYLLPRVKGSFPAFQRELSQVICQQGDCSVFKHQLVRKRYFTRGNDIAGGNIDFQGNPRFVQIRIKREPHTLVLRIFHNFFCFLDYKADFVVNFHIGDLPDDLLGAFAIQRVVAQGGVNVHRRTAVDPDHCGNQHTTL